MRELEHAKAGPQRIEEAPDTFRPRKNEAGAMKQEDNETG
jgi:hypothetical protein